MRSLPRLLQILFLFAVFLWSLLQVISVTLFHNNWNIMNQRPGVSSLVSRKSSTGAGSTTSGSVSTTNQQQPPLQHQNLRQQQAEYCLQHRGSQGHWVLDWDYAKSHQYPTHGNFPKSMIANQKFRASGKFPFLPSTAYRWQEDEDTHVDNSNSNTTCAIPTITADGFCRLAAALNVTRIYTAGDSLTEAFASSFRALVGQPKFASIQFIKKPLFMHCNLQNGQNWTVIHIYRRVQTDNTDFRAFFRDATQHETRLDFLMDHAKFPGRTIAVFNIGAHVHSMANFSTSLEHLVETVDSLLRPEDIVFFRNSVAGHAGCLPNSNATPPARRDGSLPPESKVLADKPHHNYSEYQSSLLPDDPYDWNLMEGYNAHAARVLQERRRAQLLTPSTSTKTTVIRLLNVWNATILRKDGHVGFDDCLHYNLPGPTDWWVHFWYAALQDLAVLEQDKTVYE
jgi:hypothetical protein